MESIKLRAQVGEDGILKLEVPVGQPNIEMEVLVVMQPVIALSKPKLKPLDLPTFPGNLADPNFTMRREELYDTDRG